jgi:hypothetical protein
MEYPLSAKPVLASGLGAASTYHRNVGQAEASAYRALKAGYASVVVTYLRHPVVTLTQADLAAVVNGQPETFLARKIEAGIERLGPMPTPAVRGKLKRAVIEVLRQELGLPEMEALRALALLKPYLR